MFEERVTRAKATLDEAASLKEKCPQWFNSMQSVALAQSWSKPQAARLFEDATAFEPTYYYYYDQYANYLLPKWNGQEGETEQFADAITTRIGGKEGSVIYFKIAAEVGCNCGDQKILENMSWQKMQQGYDAIAVLYGTSPLLLNQFAYMAVKMKDNEVAQKTFTDIGDNWDKGVWRTRKYFDVCKNWATYATDISKEIKAASLLIEQNLQTPEGREYDGRIGQEFATKLNDAMQKCVQKENGKDMGGFDLLIQVHNTGQVETILPSHFTTVSSCLYSKVWQTTFSPPPQSGYWVKIGMSLKP